MKLIISKTNKGDTQIVLTNNEDVKLASGGASTMKDAAMWLVSSVNRVAEQTEDMLIEMGLLTELEVEHVNVSTWYEEQMTKAKEKKAP